MTLHTQYSIIILRTKDMSIFQMHLTHFAYGRINNYFILYEAIRVPNPRTILLAIAKYMQLYLTEFLLLFKQTHIHFYDRI